MMPSVKYDRLLESDSEIESDSSLNFDFLKNKESTEDKSTLSKCCSSKSLIYTSHFLSSWGDRMWMFAGGLFLLKVTPGSLRLTAIYGTMISLSLIIFGAAIGRWVDNSQRLTACRITLLIQNLMVCICAGQIVYMIDNIEYLSTALDGWANFILQVGVIFSACIASVASLGSKLAIEKDWIIVICSSESKLASMNSILRSVDLSTEIFAPVMVGVVMTNFGLNTGGIVIAVWNVVSLIIEYTLLHHLFYSEPALRVPKNIPNETKSDHSFFYKLKTKFNSSVDGWKTYFRSEIRNAGLALATLYMTILSFDNYSRGYVFEAGVSETLLGILTALSSLSGILGAVLYPYLRTKIGVAKTGLFGFLFQTSCLVLCVSSVFAPGSVFDASYLLPSRVFGKDIHKDRMENITVSLDNGMNCTQISSEGYCIGNTNRDFTSVGLLVGGIISSRVGLWISDLSVTQLLQEKVPAAEVCTINGVQSSLNEIMSLLRSILLIILPTVETFGFLIILSFFFVASGGVLFASYCYSNNLQEKRPSLRKSASEQNDDQV